MRRINNLNVSLLFGILFLFCCTANAQEAREIDQFGRVMENDMKARLDSAFTQLGGSDGSKLLIFTGSPTLRVRQREHSRFKSYIRQMRRDSRRVVYRLGMCDELVTRIYLVPDKAPLAHAGCPG